LIRAFTLIELLVSLLIISFALVISGNLISHAIEHRSNFEARSNITSVEEAIFLLTADVENSQMLIGKPPVDLSLINEKNLLRIVLFKNVYKDGQVNFDTIYVTWLFDGNHISRTVSDEKQGLILVSGNYTFDVLSINDSAYRISIKMPQKHLSFILSPGVALL